MNREASTQSTIIAAEPYPATVDFRNSQSIRARDNGSNISYVRIPNDSEHEEAIFDHTRLHRGGEALAATEMTAPFGKVEHTTLASNNDFTKHVWLPKSIRWPWHAALMIACFLLLSATILVYLWSLLNSGIVDDDGSRGLVFASRFLPPLLAVTYGVALMILLEDVKRTEPFARLSADTPSNATTTLWHTSGPWWETLVNSFPSRRQHRPTSWALLSAVLAYILAFLVLSPLSATFLASVQVTLTSEVELARAIVPVGGFKIMPQDLTYFRTIAYIYQNVSTSAWITEDVTVLPFGSSVMSKPFLGPVLADSDQALSSKTTVFTANATCQPLQVLGVEQINDIWSNGSMSNHLSTYMELRSKDGCLLNVRFGDNLDGNGGWLWTRVPPITSIAKPTVFTVDTGITEIKSSGCQAGELILWTTPLLTEGPGLDPGSESHALICYSEYLMRNLTITASTIGQKSVVEFNGEASADMWQTIPDSILNIDDFTNTLFSLDWTQYVINVGAEPGVMPKADGPASLVMALYNSSMPQPIEANDMLSKMARIRRRFLGEVIHDSLPLSDFEASMGTISTVRRRIVASKAAALGISIALALQLVLLAAVLFTTRPGWRPLSVSTDPAVALSIAAALTYNSSARPSLQCKELQCPGSLRKQLGGYRYSLRSGVLHHDNNAGTQSSSTRAIVLEPSRSVPFVLKWWSNLLLAVVVVANIIAIAALYPLARDGELFDKAFVYEAKLSLGSREFGAMSPASIVTALLAVGISLWWGALESLVRRMQPFNTLSEAPSTGSVAASYSYQSYHLLWSAYKAAGKRDYVLSLLSVGATLSQVLTIAMSALWQLSPGTVMRSTTIRHTLQLRQIPHIFIGFVGARNLGDPVALDALQRAYSILYTNWRYSAASQLIFNSTEPAWSRNGWSFVPVDLSNASIMADGLLEKTILQADVGGSEFAADHDHKIAIETPAIRGRIECSPIESLLDQRLWLTEHDLTNTTIWNATDRLSGHERGWTLGCDGIGDTVQRLSSQQLVIQPNSTGSDACSAYLYTAYGHELTLVNRSFFTNQKHISCCESGDSTDSLGTTNIGYWSPVIAEDFTYPKYSKYWPANFTVKWLQGKLLGSIAELTNTTEASRADIEGLLWAQQPEMTALNCRPVVETAHSRITIGARSAQVYHYEILNEPSPDEWGWLDVAFYREHTPGYPDIDGYNPLVSQPWNTTVSHNVFFLLALLGATDVSSYYYGLLEPVDTDRSFAVRSPGLNVDYMSYSMLKMVNGSTTALLDPEKLYQTANATFATLFQHFVSSNTSLAPHGWAYSSINESLPQDLGAVRLNSDESGVLESHPPAPTFSTYDGPTETEATISIVVDTLQMSPTAAAISITILSCLLLILVATAVAGRGKRRLLRHIDCIADVAVLFANSDHLLSLVQHHGVDALIKSTTLRTRLGWFRGADGIVHWGIEVVSNAAGVDGGQEQRAPVEFVADAEARAELAIQQTDLDAGSKAGNDRRPTGRWWRRNGRGREQRPSSLGSTAALLSPWHHSSASTISPSTPLTVHRKPLSVGPRNASPDVSPVASTRMSGVSEFAPSVDLPPDLSQEIDVGFLSQPLRENRYDGLLFTDTEDGRVLLSEGDERPTRTYSRL